MTEGKESDKSAQPDIKENSRSTGTRTKKPAAPSISVDAVPIAYDGDKLKLLLIQRKNPPFKSMWALPGGFVEPDEALDVAVCRELEEETGVTQNLFLDQLGAYGAPDRDPRKRVISVVYIVLVPAAHMKVQSGDDAAQAQWYDIDALPELAFDHAQIVQDARERLKNLIEYANLAALYLPSLFTLADLQKVYSVFLGHNISRKQLRGLALRTRSVVKTGMYRSIKARLVRLYRFRYDAWRSGQLSRALTRV